MKKKFLTFLIALITILLFASCKDIYGDVGRENLEIITGRNFVSYKYFDTVYIDLNDVKKPDKFDIRTTKDDDWMGSRYTVLEGEFEQVAYNDGCFFVLLNQKYYVFDYENYEISEPATNIDGDYNRLAKPDYHLEEYSIDDFKRLYPDYEGFDWFSLRPAPTNQETQ